MVDLQALRTSVSRLFEAVVPLDGLLRNPIDDVVLRRDPMPSTSMASPLSQTAISTLKHRNGGLRIPSKAKPRRCVPQNDASSWVVSAGYSYRSRRSLRHQRDGSCRRNDRVLR